MTGNSLRSRHAACESTRASVTCGLVDEEPTRCGALSHHRSAFELLETLRSYMRHRATLRVVDRWQGGVRERWYAPEAVCQIPWLGNLSCGGRTVTSTALRAGVGAESDRFTVGCSSASADHGHRAIFVLPSSNKRNFAPFPTHATGVFENHDMKKGGFELLPNPTTTTMTNAHPRRNSTWNRREAIDALYTQKALNHTMKVVTDLRLAVPRPFALPRGRNTMLVFSDETPRDDSVAFADAAMCCDCCRLLSW